MKDWKLIGSVIGGTLILLVGISLLFSSPRATESAAPVDQSVLVSGATHTKGPDDAPVTVVEFADFQCPACRSAEPVVGDLLASHGDKLRLIYRHFPLTSIHQHAMDAAVAAEAAGIQGKFWEFGATLFDQQDTWSQTRDTKELFVEYAKEVEVPDLDQFQKDIEKQTGRDSVLADLGLGNKLGVDATPTFFVNGEKVFTDGLKLAVEKILSKPE